MRWRNPERPCKSGRLQARGRQTVIRPKSAILMLGGLVGPLSKERYQQPTLHQTDSGVWVHQAVGGCHPGREVHPSKENDHDWQDGEARGPGAGSRDNDDLSRAEYVITSQINVRRFLDEYTTLHVDRLASSTRAKYRNHLKNHIRPAFEKSMLCDLEPLLVQRWLDT